MKNKFITEKQSYKFDFIADIITPIIGNIFDIRSCIGEACNSYVYLVNKNLIVKFAKDEKSLNKLLLENNVLSFLRGKTSLKIPQIDVLENEFNFSVHEIIRGETFQNQNYQDLSNADKEKFCYDIARFMYELHLQTDKMKNLNIPLLKGITEIYPIEKIKLFFQSYSQLSPNEKLIISNFCDEYTNTESISARVFGHFDIQPKNIAFDFAKHKINGIFDFGDCGFCQPSYDFIQFAIQYKPEILNNVLKYYEDFSGIMFNSKQIIKGSMYRILYCLMRDIEAKRSTENGLKALRSKIYQL